MKFRLLLAGILIPVLASSQTDPEFPKGSVFYLGLKQGMNTGFNSSPNQWIGSIYFTPQFTVSPGHLRLGAQGELVYTDKIVSFLGGPKLAWKIKTIKMNGLGSLINLQLQADAMWGNRHMVYGGGLAVEAFQLLCFDLTYHYDDKRDRSWFRTGVGLRLFYKKSKKQIDPLGDD